MQDFEKLGVFYLGKIIDPKDGKESDELLLYESKNLTTHAVCVGMTGSGKTGLGIVMLEEAAIDKIPAIIIDPKGDLGNLLLTFPSLSAKDFLPWIDPAEAERKGMKPAEYAETVAASWKEGLAKWGETPQRIQRLKDSVKMDIYTPASNAGIPLSILSSFSAPPKEMLLDTAALRDRVQSTTSSLLGLIGIQADPIKSREHILISTLIDQAWRKGVNIDIAALIQQVQKPPFDKIGALDIDTFFPQKERMALSISLNNLLASPGFQAWMEGEPLDIQQLLYTAEGEPKLSILSIAHLSDSERMFFVTLLLNEILAWVRRQPGTSSLRAMLYMDEIFGYFPPNAMPPSKLPMLTLLKQARAFGLGIVLATQNPVDLDYKGLANCGTWFIGKLQTERDKMRVIEGLNTASNGEFTAGDLNKMLALTGNRTFIMRSVHEKNPILFQTRWTLSYLRGPLTLSQIATLTDKTERVAQQITKQASQEGEKPSGSTTKPASPPGIPEYFMRVPNLNGTVHYQPCVAGMAKLHFVDTKNKVDIWRDVCIIANANEDGKSVQWEQGQDFPDAKDQFDKEPKAKSTFEDLPAGLMQAKNYTTFVKELAASLYQNQTLTIFKAPELNLISNERESEADFRVRVSLALRERRDEMVKKIKDKYAEKIAVLTEKARRADEKVSQKKQQTGWQAAETVLSVGTTILGALFGRGITKTTISQAGTSLKKAGKIGKDSQTASQAEEDSKAIQQQLSDLQEQLKNETDKVLEINPDAIKIDSLTIRPRKSDVSVEKAALVWRPVL